MFIETQNLHKTYGGRPALAGVSLIINRGETVVVTGPSGAGKTTLMRCLNGLDRADAGSIRVGDCVLAAGDKHHERILLALRRRVGVVFQQWHLFAHRTVLQNVVEGPIYVLGMARPQATARARALIERVGITDRADAYPDELSGGEQQRAAIARALAMKPQVLLMDEPTSALDSARVDDLLALLRELRCDRGAGAAADIAEVGEEESTGVPTPLTMIVVSHDARLATGLGGRRVVMAQGRIVDDSGNGAPTPTKPTPDDEAIQRSNI